MTSVFNDGNKHIWITLIKHNVKIAHVQVQHFGPAQVGPIVKFKLNDDDMRNY